MIASTMSVAILAAMNEVGTSYILRNFCVFIYGMRGKCGCQLHMYNSKP
jgi:hypothetical protein